MLSRRSFLNSTLGAGAGMALAAQGSRPAAAQSGGQVVAQAQAPQPARRRMIVDSQVHMWLAQAPDRPWPADGRGRAHLPYPFTYDKLLPMMDEAGVDRVVIVPPSWEGERNDYGLEAARKYPNRFAVMQTGKSCCLLPPPSCVKGLLLNEAAGVVHAEFMITFVGVVAVVRTDEPPVHEPRDPVVNDILGVCQIGPVSIFIVETGSVSIFIVKHVCSEITAGLRRC